MKNKDKIGSNATRSSAFGLRYALAEADASFKSTMQARGTGWVALSNGRGQIARSPTVKEVDRLNFHKISVWRHCIHHGYHSIVAPCKGTCVPDGMLPAQVARAARSWATSQMARRVEHARRRGIVKRPTRHRRSFFRGAHASWWPRLLWAYIECT